MLASAHWPGPFSTPGGKINNPTLWAARLFGAGFRSGTRFEQEGACSHLFLTRSHCQRPPWAVVGIWRCRTPAPSFRARRARWSQTPGLVREHRSRRVAAIYASDSDGSFSASSLANASVSRRAAATDSPEKTW